MVFVKWILFICLLLEQTSGNPWQQDLPTWLPWQPLPVPPYIPDTLQQAMLANLTSHYSSIFSSFKGFGNLGNLGNQTQCNAKLSQLTSGLTSFNPESIAFIDALGKPGSGITTGNFLWLGNYEMCGTGALENETTGYKYENCVVSAPLTLGGYPLGLVWTGCSPPECRSTADLQDAFKQIATLINKSGIIHTDPAKWTAQCDVKQEFDAGAYAAVTIISIFTLLVVAGTLWFLLEPIIISFMEGGKDDTTVLVDAEESPYEDVDKQTTEEKYETANQPEWLLSRFMKCFALQRTMETLFSTTTKPGQVLCLNGIRVLSINWVVLGHSYLIAITVSSSNGFTYATQLLKRRNFLIIFNGFPSVDSFFALSGFLVTYLLLKQLAKRGGLTPPQWIAFYLHRYVRLTLPYLVAMLVEGWLYRLVMTGPTAQQVISSPQSPHAMCQKYWYHNLLYINNLVPWKNSGSAACVGQGWYLANDMQFFLIAPIFIVLLLGRPLLGVAVTGGTILCSVITAAVITAHYHLGPASTADPNPDEFWLMYTKPWIRITPYLVGILGGWFYWKWGQQVTDRVKTLPEWRRVVCAAPIWAVTAAVEYAVVFGLYHDIQLNINQTGKPGEVESVSYQSLARIAWSLSLTTQILMCQCGLGGFINSLLSWSGWQILSRLTYSVFLLHLGLITVLAGQMRHAFFLNPDFEFAVFYLGMLTMSYLSAAVLYLTVEQPVANLEGITYRKST